MIKCNKCGSDQIIMVLSSHPYLGASADIKCNNCNNNLKFFTEDDNNFQLNDLTKEE